MGFPPGFLWGAGASDYQIEGGAFADGRGLSVWDVYSHTEGKIARGHTGDIACDHYHRYAEDVALMQAIGLQAYRFSINWPRVLPTGEGKVNPVGLDFYDRLVDTLVAANIQPIVTLFHWSFPHALYLRGGWLNRDVADWFAEFADVVVRRLGDRVTTWLTLNEPAAVVGAGHYWAVHAPGLRLGYKEALLAGLHTCLAHGKAVQAIRAASPGPCQVSAALDTRFGIPASDSLADIEAARSLEFRVTQRNIQANALWIEPILSGIYPESATNYFGTDVPHVTADDLRTIHQPLDFIGLNMYFNPIVEADPEGNPVVIPYPPGAPCADNWFLTPESLYWGPRFFWERFGLPILVTENGMPGQDWVALDGRVHDAQRIDFTARYLAQLHRAHQDSVQLKGYLHWSVMDNFEWQSGYFYRFGLIHVDFGTLRRTPKDSAAWYHQVIASNGDKLFASSETLDPLATTT